MERKALNTADLKQALSDVFNRISNERNIDFSSDLYKRLRFIESQIMGSLDTYHELLKSLYIEGGDHEGKP